MSDRDHITIIIGNGLGMAVDDMHFRLHNAIKDAKEYCDWLEEDEERIISDFVNSYNISDGEDTKSKNLFSEPDLKKIQEIVNTFNLIQNVGRGEWLTTEGKKIPELLNKFNFLIAKQLARRSLVLNSAKGEHIVKSLIAEHKGEEFECDEVLLEKIKKFNDFMDDLCVYIKSSNRKVNVATLNYDTILYDAFLDKEISFGKYNETFLADGFTTKGFSSKNLERRQFGFGYYMHLHGSPLFYNDGETVKKYKRNELLNSVFCPDQHGMHIVLTHSDYKVQNIRKSNLLMTYWKKFAESIKESKTLVLFGYSGLDTHLNELISKYISDDTSVYVVEYEDASHLCAFCYSECDKRIEDNKKYITKGCQRAWEDIFFNKIFGIEHIHKENILDFRFTSLLNK